MRSIKVTYSTRDARRWIVRDIARYWDPVWLQCLISKYERLVGGVLVLAPETINGDIMRTIRPGRFRDKLWKGCYLGALYGSKHGDRAMLEAAKKASGKYWSAGAVAAAACDAFAWNSEYYAATLLDALEAESRILRMAAGLVDFSKDRWDEIKNR